MRVIVPSYDETCDRAVCGYRKIRALEKRNLEERDLEERDLEERLWKKGPKRRMTMDYITTGEAAVRWNVSERSVRHYCAKGRVHGAVLFGGNWMIPTDSRKPTRKVRGEGLKKE